MMINLLTALKKTVLTLLFIPIFIARSISKLISVIIRTLMYSIRGRITANFLALYAMAAFLMFSYAMMSFLLLQLDEQKNQIYLTVNTAVDRYEAGVFDEAVFVNRLNAIAELNNCGIKLILPAKEAYTSGLYEGYELKESFIEKSLIFFRGLYAASVDVYTFNSPKEQETGRLYLLLPIKAVRKSLSSLAFILLTGFSFVYIFLWLFGSSSVRKMLSPVYEMTLEAKKISISNMDKRLLVSKAKYELKDLAITLNDMMDRLSEDYTKQKRFVSDVSHELRTPISIINGYANMLERWGKSDEAILDEAIGAIISEVKNMQKLVENLLTLVRSDNQTLVYNKELFYLDDLVDAVIKESQMINEKSQNISFYMDQAIQVELDQAKIKQMLRIFVDNAVKYTPEGGRIEIRCYKAEDKCTLHIIDTGIGISKEDLTKIFDRFYRSDESRTRGTGGHGLGLAIAKVIVLGHNGSIRVKSKINEGSEFIITLPCVNC